MRIIKAALSLFLLATAAVVPTACDDSKSYADLLHEQDKYVNNFLADQRVELAIPEDTVFITGPDAPYYRLDDDGTMYMQVLDAGTPGNRVTDNEQIYFRYTRYALASYDNGKLPTGGGNNVTLSPCWFRYKNYSIQSSYNWGVGVQTPLDYLPVDCKVNIVLKAQMGFIQEQSDVQPYLFYLTYERRQQ